MQTGWTGEAPPAMPVTEFLLGATRQHEPGAQLEMAQARSRAAEARDDREAEARKVDADARAAGLVTRGYSPGALSQLAVRLADTEAELEHERAKIEAGERRAGRVMEMHARGQITAPQIPVMLDGEEGDRGRAEKLERRARSLRAQMAEVSDAVAPRGHRQADIVEQAATRAQQELARYQAEYDAEYAADRRRMAAERAAFRAGRRPFGDGGDAPAADVEYVRAGAGLRIR